MEGWRKFLKESEEIDYESMPTPITYTQSYHDPERFDFEDLGYGEELWLALMQPKENKEEAKKLANKGLYGSDSSLGNRLEAMDYDVETRFNEKGHLEISAEIGGFGFIAAQGDLPGVEMESMVQFELKSIDTDEERIEALKEHESGVNGPVPLDGDFHLRIQSIPSGRQLKEIFTGPNLLIQVLSRELIERDTVDFENMRNRLNKLELNQAKDSKARVDAMNAQRQSGFIDW